MRRIALLLAIAVIAAFNAIPAGAAQSALTYLDPGVGGFMSANLSYVGTLANESPGVGAKIVTVNGKKRFYVSSVQGLSVYDVTNPALPLPLGHLELPHWENEDVTVSKDGKTILMSEFTGTYMHVIEARDLPNGLLALVPVGFTTGPSGHIVDCIDDACNMVYGSEGKMIDLRDKTKPTVLKTNWATMNGLPTNGHNLQFDDAGLLWTDTTPISALDVSDPLNPVAVVKGNKSVQTSNKTAYQHNNIRPNAAMFDARDTEEEIADPNLRPGELLMGNGETNFTGTCNSGSGPFSTYKIKNMTPGNTDALAIADVFRPVSGQYTDGNPAVNAIGCSGHWFTVQPASTVVPQPPAPEEPTDPPASAISNSRAAQASGKGRAPGTLSAEAPTAEATATPDYLVAAAWYEHGTRLLSVDKASGEITQKGFFQPVAGSASAAHWINDEYVYVVDYVRGVDILRYNKGAATPTTAEFDASWLAKAYATDPASERARLLCRLVTQD